LSRNNHTISLLGGNVEENALLGRLLGARADAAWQLGEAAHADVLCVDVDSVYGHMDWLKAQSSGRPVIALSSSDPHGAEYHLRKPIGGAALFGLLDQIATRLPPLSATRTRSAAPPTSTVVEMAAHRPAPAARPPAAEAARPVAAPEVSRPIAAAAPARGPMTLLDLLDTPSPTPMRLRAKGLQTLFLDGEAHLAYAPDITLKSMTAWCTLAMTDASIEPLDAAAFATATQELDSLPYARLSWLAHLVGSDGQLETALDPAGRYKLARWPQSEREFPKHFRIATAMMKAPATIDEIVAASGSSAQDVANFINAYHSSGHVEVESAAKSAAAEPRRGGLFGRNKKNIEE